MNKENPSEPATGREERISLLRLEKYLRDELPPGERAKLERDAAQNPLLASSLAEMRETRSALDWRRLRGRLASPDPVAAAQPAGLLAFFSRLGKRMEAWLPNPTGPKLAWAGAFALLFLLVPAVLFPLKSDSGIRAKGHAHAEVVLEIGGSRLSPGQKRNVQTGDILGFSYRSIKPIYTQIWYREDGGAPNLFDGRAESSLFWPASTGWSPAPQRIRLEGDWKNQSVIIVTSREKITAEDARRIILGEMKPNGHTELLTYDLMHP
jgi:hypothetical protein